MPLVQKPFGDIITFTRASSATMFDSSGTLVYAPMNLLTYSEQFDDAAWTRTNANVTANTAVAPDGTATADTIGDNGTLPARVGQTVTVVSGAIYTASVYLKAGTQNVVFFREDSEDALSVQINLSTGTVIGGTGTITAVGNGWYRVTFSGSVVGTSFRPEIRITSAGNVLAWGAQLNIANMQGGVTGSLSTYYPTTSAAYQGPRLDYDPATLLPRGFLVEGQRTNSIRNNTMQGAVAGTPGTLPTNWSGAVAGLTRDVVAIGTDKGINYIDVRFSGTSTSTTATIVFESQTEVVASVGETWALSTYLALVGGSTTNINSINLTSVESDAAGTGSFVLTTVAGMLATLTGSLQRFSGTRTIAAATTARINSRISINFSVGRAIDITLRIGLPQLELGAFETSAIPTTTTALTRSADVAAVNTLSPWFNATASTLYAEFVWEGLKSLIGQSYIQLDDGTNNNRWIYAAGSSNQHQITTVSGGTGDGSATTPSIIYSSNVVYKVAAVLSANNLQAFINGSAGTADTSVTLPVGLNNLKIGANLSATSNVWFRRLTYYPRVLSSAEGIAITT